MALSQRDVALIREQVRATVDPLLLRLRSDIFGTAYNTTIRESLVPTSVIVNAISDGIEEATGGGSIVPAQVSYTAGSGGIQAGKVVYFDGSVVHHADSSNIAHVGKVVGVASTAAGPGDPVPVQMYGILDLPGTYSLTPASAQFLNTTGFPTASLPGGAVFVQYVGIALTSTRLLVYVTPEVYVL
jgi:predicted RecA/RadA family phage recombinase